METKKQSVKKPAAKKTSAKKAAPTQPEHIGLVRNDSWLEPFEGAIRGRHDHAVWKMNQLTQNGKKTLSQFASGHLYLVCISCQRVGCSVSGLLTLPISI